MDNFNSSSRPWNTTNDCPAYIWHMKIISPIVTAVSLLGVAGNGLILYFLLCSIKWDRFSVFLLHLALADFTLLTCLVVDFTRLIFWFFHETCYPLPYLELFTFLSSTAGFWLVVAISMARSLSVLFPIWFRLYSPKYSATIVCILIWLLAISLTALFKVFCFNDSAVVPLCSRYITGLRLCLFTVLCATLLCMVIMLLQIKCNSWVRPTHKLYIAVALAAVSLLSLALLKLVTLLPGIPHASYYMQVVPLSLTVNSSANPLIYYFAGRMGRQKCQPTLREVFQKAMGEDLGLFPGAPGRCTYGSSTRAEVIHPVGQGS